MVHGILYGDSGMTFEDDRMPPDPLIGEGGRPAFYMEEL